MADMDDTEPISVTEQFEHQISQLPADILASARTLIALGRESARRFDEGHDPAGSRLRLVLADLHKLTERWERLTMPAPQPQPAKPERSQLDELRARREQLGRSAR